MFYRYEHYMSISHMAVSCINCEYGTLVNFCFFLFKISQSVFKEWNHKLPLGTQWSGLHWSGLY